MVDYVKILVLNANLSDLKNNPLLEFKSHLNENTGVVSGKKASDYFNCKITILESGLILFTGSIHKLSNALKCQNSIHRDIKKYENGFNGNDFTYTDFVQIRKHLTTLFKCENEDLIIQNIEFGYNLKLHLNPKKILNGLLIHKGKSFEYKFLNNYAQSIHNRFIFKIYDKGSQYELNENVLRVELKITKMEEVKTIGITNMADINKEVFIKMNKLLVQRWNEILFYDSSIRKDELTKKLKEQCLKYSNPRFWIDDLKPNHRDRHKKQLQKIITNHSSDLKQGVAKLISQKCVINNLTPETDTCVINNSSNIELNTTKKTQQECKRYCPLTGLEISMQKENSFLLSHTGLKHYFINDHYLFEKLKARFLKLKWNNCSFPTQIEEMAHNIRDNWRSHKRVYGYEEQTTLFSYKDIICNSNQNHFKRI